MSNRQRACHRIEFVLRRGVTGRTRRQLCLNLPFDFGDTMAPYHWSNLSHERKRAPDMIQRSVILPREPRLCSAVRPVYLRCKAGAGHDVCADLQVVAETHFEHRRIGRHAFDDDQFLAAA